MEVCLICHRWIFDGRTSYELDCEHIFHGRCLLHFFRNHLCKYAKCPTCGIALSMTDRCYFYEAVRGRVILFYDDDQDSGYDSS